MLPDLDSFATLGGTLNQYSVVEDATTDLPASADNAMRADCAAMTRMSLRGYCVFVYNGSTTSITEADAVWGNSPLYYPTPLRTGTGVFTLTFPATVPYADGAGSMASVNLRRGWGNVEASQILAKPERTSANVLTVRCYNPSTLAAADPTNLQSVIYFI